MKEKKRGEKEFMGFMNNFFLLGYCVIWVSQKDDIDQKEDEGEEVEEEMAKKLIGGGSP